MQVPPPRNIVAVFNTTCNYFCRFCSQHLPNKIMRCWTFEQIQQRLGSLFDNSVINNIGGCGEVTVLPFFEDLLSYLDTKPGKVCFNTNGYLLKPQALRTHHVDHIVVSLHSLIPEVYNHLTGTSGRLDRVVENLTEAAKQPRDYRVVVAAVTTNLNVRESPRLAQFAIDIGADEMRFMPLADPQVVGVGKYDEDLPLQETPENLAALAEAREILAGQSIQTNRILSTEERQDTVSTRMNLCRSPWQQILIGPDGHVQPCCFIPQDHTFGNVFETPWEEIWNGERYQRFREEVANNNCQLCLDYCQNWG